MKQLVNDDLGLRSLTLRVLPLITEAQRGKRVQRAKALINWMKGRGKGKVIVFSDEKNFTVDPVRNSRNDRHLARSVAEASPEARAVTKTKHPASVMVLGFVSSDGSKGPIVFVPAGMRLSAATYQQLLQAHVVPWLAANYPAGNYVWQQDGAPAHTAATTQQFLQENVAEFWPASMWPPSSPDLNPLDYGIWAHVEATACSKRLPSIEALRSAIRTAWTRMSESFVSATCRSFRRRLQRVVDTDGSFLQ